MKKLVLTTASISLLFLIACNEEKKEASVKEFDSYVDSVNTLTLDNQKEHWANIEAKYQVKYAKAKANAETEVEKKKVEDAESKFQKIRDNKSESNGTSVDVEEDATRSANGTLAPRKQKLRDALFGAGKIGTDLDFKWVTAQNILGVYENFVATVKANKDSYSREDWDEVKVLYEALDTRKNEVEKELSSKDNMQIAKRKVEFASIKAVERPSAKVSENENAKEKDK